MVVQDRGGVLTVYGSETKGDERLDLQGLITSTRQEGSVFDGTITKPVRNVAAGAPCTRSGTMQLKTTGKHKYWRCRRCRPL